MLRSTTISSHGIGQSRLARVAERIALAAIVIVMIAVTSAVAIAAPISESDFNRCKNLPDATARLRCFEGLASQQTPHLPGASQMTSPQSQSIGSWRLVRTPNPQGGKETISVMRPVELTGSDLDFAGLMIRCGDTGPEVLAVLIRPLPPRAKPKISINGAKFSGTVVPPGATILLPPEAGQAAQTDWRLLTKLSIGIDNAGTVTKGVIALDGLGDALTALNTNCALR